MRGFSQTITLATGNAGKAKEFRKLLGDFWKVRTLKDVPGVPEIVEDGDTFEANALIKAQAVSRVTEGLVLADDSGLEVDALKGAPGVRSARYAGEDASDDENNEKLAKALDGERQRGAQFRCVLALVEDGKVLGTYEGICRGHIAEKRGGEGGFGYDPYFIPEGYEESFGNLSVDVKNRISHRAKAFREVINVLHHRERVVRIRKVFKEGAQGAMVGACTGVVVILFLEFLMGVEMGNEWVGIAILAFLGMVLGVYYSWRVAVPFEKSLEPENED